MAAQLIRLPWLGATVQVAGGFHHRMDELLETLARLDSGIADLAPSPRHWVPDLVLLGYLCEVVDNARAVACLLGQDSPLHAIPAARSSFEATQNLLMLVTARSYDEAGALAYVYGLRKDQELTRPYWGEGSNVAPEDGGPGWFEAATHEIAETWEQLAPGAERFLVQARATILGRKTLKPDNWHGMNPAEELAARLKDHPLLRSASGGDPASVFRNVYRALCRDTHPRTVVRPLGIRQTSEGVLHTDLQRRKPEDTMTIAMQVTTGSSVLALAAHRARLTFDDA